MARPVVLVTGLSGLSGRPFLRHEGDVYDVGGRNRRPVAGVPAHQADVASPGGSAPAVTGPATVVHLAAAVGSTVPFEVLLRDNMAGTYNVFESARRAGVRRIVYASSGNTVTAWEREMPYRALVDGHYEELGLGRDARALLRRRPRPVGDLPAHRQHERQGPSHRLPRVRGLVQPA